MFTQIMRRTRRRIQTKNQAEKQLREETEVLTMMIMNDENGDTGNDKNKCKYISSDAVWTETPFIFGSDP